MKETYFELDGQVAGQMPKKNGGMRTIVPSGKSIAEFWMDGTIISKDEYIKLGGTPIDDDF